MELQLAGKNAGNVTVSDDVFACERVDGLVHQIVTAYMAGSRQSTKGQKSRAEVSGGGAKPWRQKGTGRARAGSIRSPIWRGGGFTFAHKVRNYQQKVNQKMYRKGMRVILSELARDGRLVVVDDIKFDAPKTRELLGLLAELKLEHHALIITAEHDTNVFLSGRNVPHVDVITAGDINPVNLIAYKKVVVTKDALKKIEEKLS